MIRVCPHSDAQCVHGMNCAYTCATDAYDGNKNLMAEQNATRTPAPEGEVVAWRVKDYADGWILFYHEAPARASGEARNGALVQPLYASPVVPVSREELGFDHLACAVEKMRSHSSVGWGQTTITRKEADAILAALGTKGADHD
jgi:hypothetical protein